MSRTDDAADVDHEAVVEAVVDGVADAAPEIRAGLPTRWTKVEGDEGENPSGEQQLAADAYADALLIDRMRAIDGVGTYASEERENPIDVGSGLSVAIDPLDGSSNLQSNNLVGTIFAVYDGDLPATGDDLIAAGYLLYGPVTNMLVAHDGTVTEYLVQEGETRVRREDVRLPDEPKIYGFGGRVPDWFDDYAAFVDHVERDEGMKLRYGGSMVGDVNQVLTYGGIFSYPASVDAPEGKLRLQFEGYPVGYIVETAGGRSSDGERSLLDVEPSDLHSRVPVHVGNADLIDRLEDALD